MTNKSDEPMFEIDSRPARLGTNINTFRVKKGDENVPCVSIRVVGITLTADEVDKMLPHFTRAFFDTKGKHKLPAFPQLGEFTYRNTFEGATVRLVPGVNGQGKAIELEDCKIKGLVFEPQSGGATLLSLTVISEAPDALRRLADRLDGEVHIEIADAALAEKKAKDAQQDLPINTFGEGERPAAH